LKNLKHFSTSIDIYKLFGLQKIICLTLIKKISMIYIKLHPAWFIYAKATGSDLWFIFFGALMPQQRVICFIDGFNLYHAIDKLNMPYLKWINLKCLASVFIRPKSQVLVDVYYFSAYANWLPKSKKRHLQYVKALNSVGVKLVMGKFKSKKQKMSKMQNFLEWP